MEFVFQGFQSSLPIWLFGLLIPAVILLAWWSYRNLNDVSNGFRILLIAIRSAVFVVLVILLLNPFFRAEETVTEDPGILLILDASASTGIQKNDYLGMESYRGVFDELNLSDRENLSLEPYTFSGDIAPLSSLDSLRAEGSETNLYNIYDILENRRREADAAILLTDGIFTSGRNPVFEAGSSPLPIFTVALGDTAGQRDLLVENVVTNSTGYLDTAHPVKTTVRTEGYAGETVQVELRRGEELLETRTVTPDEENGNVTLDYEIQLSETGLRQFQVVIPPHSGEWSEENNRRTFSIDVLDNQQRMLSIAFEIHPDVRHLRSLLAADQNSRLSTRTWLGGSRFVGGPFRFEADSLDLLIVHGYPGSGLPGEVTKVMNELMSEVPSLLLSTPRADFASLQREIELPLPVSVSNTGAAVEVTPLPAADSTAHPVMELPSVVYDRMPALQAPVGGLQPVPSATMLFESRYMGEATGIPLITVSETGNLRNALVSGYGWYRLGQSPAESNRAFVRELMMNLVSWTVTRPDNRMLVVEPEHQSFPGGEPVLLNAYLRNESGEYESGASLQVTLEGEEIEERFYSMRNNGPGRYSLEIPPLPEGMYSYRAEATRGDRTIDIREGEFTVSGSSSELVDTRRKDLLLQQISERSGGAFFTYNRLDAFWDSLESRNLLQRNERVRESLFYPYRHAGWFIAVILLLTTEWVVRKYLSLP